MLAVDLSGPNILPAMRAISFQTFLILLLVVFATCHSLKENSARNPSRKWKRATDTASSRENSIEDPPTPQTATDSPEVPPILDTTPPESETLTTTEPPPPEGNMNTTTPKTGMMGRGLFGLNILGGGGGRDRGSLLDLNVLGGSSRSSNRKKERKQGSGGSLLNLNVLGGGGNSGSLLNANILSDNCETSDALINVDILSGGGCKGRRRKSGTGSLLNANILGGGHLRQRKPGEEPWEEAIIDDSPENSSEEGEGNGVDQGRRIVEVQVDIFHGHHAKKPGPTDKVIRCNSSFDIMKHPNEVYIVQSQDFGTEEQYPAGTSCKWVLKGGGHCVLAFQCHKVDIRDKCMHEYLDIYDDGQPRGSTRLCRKSSMRKPIRAHSGHNINVFFKTAPDPYFKRLYKGFQCKVKCSSDPDTPVRLPPPTSPPVIVTEKELEVCGVEKEYNISTIRKIVVKSKLEPTANKLKHKATLCTVFVSGSASCRVQATCEKLDLQSPQCDDEHVRLYDAPLKRATKSVKICDKKELKIPFQSFSSEKDNGILFETKLYGQYAKSGHKGTRCTFECKPVPMTPPPIVIVNRDPKTQLCSTQKRHELGVKKDRTLIIQSLKYGTGTNYPAGQSCAIDVIGDSTCSVQIVCPDFDFRPEECVKEHLEIFNSIQVKGRNSTKLCGATGFKRPYFARKFTDGTNALHIMMTTSGKKHSSEVFKGFNCKVTCYEDKKRKPSTTAKPKTTRKPKPPIRTTTTTKKPRPRPSSTQKPRPGGTPATEEPPPTATTTTEEPIMNTEEPPPEDIEATSPLPPEDTEEPPPLPEPEVPEDTEEPPPPPPEDTEVPPTTEEAEVSTTENEEHMLEVEMEVPTTSPPDTTTTTAATTTPTTTLPPTTSGPQCHYQALQASENDEAWPKADICDSPIKNLTINSTTPLKVHSTNFVEGETELNYYANRECSLFIYGNEDCLASVTCWNVDLRRFGRQVKWENCSREYVEFSDGLEDWRHKIRICHGTLLRDPFVASTQLQHGTPNGVKILFKTDPDEFDRFYDGFYCIFSCAIKVCEDPQAADQNLDKNVLEEVSEE